MEPQYSRSNQKIKPALRGWLSETVPTHTPVPSDNSPVEKHSEAIADIIDASPAGQFDGE